jgi:hypothetical protein
MEVTLLFLSLSSSFTLRRFRLLLVGLIYGRRFGLGVIGLRRLMAIWFARALFYGFAWVGMAFHMISRERECALLCY